ncbi:MAG: Hsp20/alpha crystallin family protein [Dehalococcoidia bacterium]|nr:Hsp20/alpha crystallin family protein [Dehalococcoidia bacterium]
MPDGKKAGEAEFDFGIGKLRFSNMFKGIGNLIDMAAKLGEETEEIERSGEIQGLPKDVKGVYGFSIKTLAGNKPVVETFGNIKDSPRGPVVEEIREPIMDIFDEEAHIMVIVELPGVDEKNINIEVAGDILKLAATGKNSKYAKEVLLPASVDINAMATSYKNGILEITLPKCQ